MLNRTVGYNNQPVFPYSSEPTAATPQDLDPTESIAPTKPTDEVEAASSSSIPTNPLLSTAASRSQQKTTRSLLQIPDADLEGFTDDPNLTKVVDRRWYERQKHIYPASIWEDFDPARDYSKGARKDGEGNAFFF